MGACPKKPLTPAAHHMGTCWKCERVVSVWSETRKWQFKYHHCQVFNHSVNSGHALCLSLCWCLSLKTHSSWVESSLRVGSWTEACRAEELVRCSGRSLSPSKMGGYFSIIIRDTSWPCSSRANAKLCSLRDESLGFTYLYHRWGSSW